MVRAAALIFALASPQDTPPPLDVIADIRLGDSEESAVKRLERLGSVARKKGIKGGITLKAGDTDVTICRNRVVHVSRTLGRSFNQFAQLAHAFIKTHGAPATPDIFTANIERPATDPEGAFKAEIAVIRLTWAKAPHYFLGYVDVDGHLSVAEALNAPVACTE